MATPPKNTDPIEVEKRNIDTRNTKRNNYKKETTITIEKTGKIIGRGDTKVFVDPEDVYKLAKIHCTISEIARYLGCTDNALKSNFSEELTKGYEESKQSLRRAQLKTALSGNPTMLIWLGKNILKQSETPLNENEEKRLHEILPTIVRRISEDLNSEDIDEDDNT